ncbi:dipeptidase PepV [Streptococcus dentapri]|uniref:Dipeptidase PepV n=1 Tax=Streptococcus dentapri TaxID=573564 RepID=A0ABV8CZX7_9STRE
MTVDFKAEIDKRRNEMMEDLFNLLAINSERDDTKVDKDHPFGPGPVEALEHFLAMAERDGYQTRNIDNYAGDFEFGQGDETLGIFAHLDVVPAGTGWNTDPYQPVIKDGKLYARGSSDDKGPTLAAYYALKIIKDLGLPISKKVRFVLGTDEESGWGDMAYYFAHPDVQKPDFGFAPDAEFPIINGEKGNITEYLHFAGDNQGDVVLHHFTGGLRENMVPESATAIISGQISLEELQDKLSVFLAAHPQISGSVMTKDHRFTVQIIGKAAHGSTPEEGLNGATYLALFLNQFTLAGPAQAFVQLTADILHDDFAGHKLGVAHEDTKMGSLSVNAGVFNFEESSSDNTIALNFRYPQGTDSASIKAGLEKLSGVEKVTISEHEHTPHYVPIDDPLVATLLSVYEKQTGLKGYEQIIGGGTFGRLLERGVAFGAMFPDYENTMHQANEFVDVEELYRAAAIYAEAIYELIK